MKASVTHMKSLSIRGIESPPLLEKLGLSASLMAKAFVLLILKLKNFILSYSARNTDLCFPHKEAVERKTSPLGATGFSTAY